LSHCRHLFHVRELNEGSLVRDRPGNYRRPVFARSVFSTILCVTPRALRVCVVFLENKASRSRPCAFLHFLQPLSSETSIFDKPSKSNSWLEFCALFKNVPNSSGEGGDAQNRGKHKASETFGAVFGFSVSLARCGASVGRHPPPRSSVGRFGDWLGLDWI
jgi:hypothetical protein